MILGTPSTEADGLLSMELRKCVPSDPGLTIDVLLGNGRVVERLER